MRDPVVRNWKDHRVGVELRAYERSRGYDILEARFSGTWYRVDTAEFSVPLLRELLRLAKENEDLKLRLEEAP